MTSTASALRARFNERLATSSDAFDVYRDYYAGVPVVFYVVKSGDTVTGARLAGAGRWDLMKEVFGKARKAEHATSIVEDSRQCTRDSFDKPFVQMADLRSETEDGATKVIYADLGARESLFSIVYGSAASEIQAVTEQLAHSDKPKQEKLNNFARDWNVRRLRLQVDKTTPVLPDCAYYTRPWGGYVNLLGRHVPQMTEEDRQKLKGVSTAYVFGELKQETGYEVDDLEGRAQTVSTAMTADWAAFEKTIVSLEKEHGPATEAVDRFDAKGHLYSYRAWAPSAGVEPAAVIAMNFQKHDTGDAGDAKVVISAKPYDEVFEARVLLAPDSEKLKADLKRLDDSRFKYAH
jgi:hypothetical protein